MNIGGCIRSGRAAQRMLRGAALALVCAAGFLAPAAAQGAAYWGGTIKGEVYGISTDAPKDGSVLATFEQHAGKQVTVINTSQAWASFDKPTMQAAFDAGTIPVVTMGLPAGVTLADVAAGHQDQAIRDWADDAKAWGYSFLFEPWWEMNGAWYSWGRSPAYVAAWRHFHDLVVAEGATNVTWTWTVNALWSDPASDPTPYYPGGAYVDWIGMDGYNWGLNPQQPDRWLTPEQALGPTLAKLKEIAPEKPVCICENASSEFGGNKASWIREMLGSYLPSHPEIKAYLYFNWNFPENGGRHDWPIESSPPALEAFRDGIQGSTYLSSLPPLTRLAKVPIPAEPPAGGSPASVAHPIPGAEGGWSGSVAPGSGGGAARHADLAVGPDGNATMTWERFDGSHFVIESRRLAPGGTPSGPVLQLSAGGQDAFGPQVVAAPDGTVTVAWKRFDGSNFIVQERQIDAQGTPEAAAHALSGAGGAAGEQQLAVGGNGAVTVVWERYNGTRSVVQAKRIPPGGAPSAGMILSANTQNAVEPVVAAAPDGSAFVAWDRYDGSDQIVQEGRIDSSGFPEAVAHDLSAAGESAIQPQVAVGPDGSARVVWTRFDGADQIVQSRGVTPAGEPGVEVLDLSAAGEAAMEPQLAIRPDGSAIVVWERFAGSGLVIQARRIGADGAPEAGGTDVSLPGASAHEPRVTVAPDGVATVLWDRFDGSHTIVQARRIPAGGSPAGITVDLSSPAAASGAPVVAAGVESAFAAWTRFEPSGDGVEAAAFGVPRASITPGAHGFGQVTVGSQPVSAPVTVTNTGTSLLAVSSIALEGRDPAEFEFAGASPCAGALLEPGAACTVSVGFAPRAPGSFEAALRVASNAASSPLLVQLSGTATAPASAGALDNRFRVGRPEFNKRDGTARLPVSFPGPGVTSLTGAGIRVRIPGGGEAAVKVKTRLAGAGKLSLKLIPSLIKRRTLRIRGVAKVGLTIAYTPRGGDTRRRAVSLRLRLRPARHGLGR